MAGSKQVDRDGYRKMAEAAREGRLDVVRDLIRKGYDPNVDIGDGYHPPAYWACRYGRYELLRELIEKYGCNPKYVTGRGTTLLHVACTKGHVKIARYLANGHLLDPNIKNREGVSMLFSACYNGHLEIMKFLEKELRVCCDPRANTQLYEGESHSLLHTACTRGHLDIVKYLIGEKFFPADLKFTFDETPLLVACSNGHLPVVRYLIEEVDCNTAHVDKSGTTALHVACQDGHSAVVKYLVDEYKCNPSCRDNCGNTPLHIACRYGRLEVVKILLQTGQIDPSCTTESGEAPIEIAKDKLIIRELIRKGAQTRGMRLNHFQPASLQEALMRVFVVGHPSSGKSTLVKALQPEQSAPRKSIMWRYKKVTGVMPQTAGIIPTEFDSPEFGRVLMFDFAGQSEYYGSHAALLECSNTSSAPLFLLVVDLSESDADIQHKMRFWLTFLESHRISTTSKPHIIIVGSHKDVLKKEPRSDYKTKASAIESFAYRIVSTSTSLHMAGFFAIDCREPRKQSKLRHSLKQSCEKLRSNVKDDNICHFLSVFLLEQFQDRMTCTIKEVLERVQRSEELPIPCQAVRLCELCEALSDRMSILFLKNEQDVEKSWIVLDIDSLLQKIHGRIFAPKGFREHVFAPSSTGILPFSAIKKVFSEDGLDPSLVVAFLKQLEMCQTISDTEILQLIRGGNPSLKPPRSDSDDDTELDSPSIRRLIIREVDTEKDNVKKPRDATTGPATTGPASYPHIAIPGSQQSPPEFTHSYPSLGRHRLDPTRNQGNLGPHHHPCVRNSHTRTTPSDSLTNGHVPTNAPPTSTGQMVHINPPTGEDSYHPTNQPSHHEIENPQGPKIESEAEVPINALMDALMGASSVGQPNQTPSNQHLGAGYDCNPASVPVDIHPASLQYHYSEAVPSPNPYSAYKTSPTLSGPGSMSQSSPQSAFLYNFSPVPSPKAIQFQDVHMQRLSFESSSLSQSSRQHMSPYSCNSVTTTAAITNTFPPQLPPNPHVVHPLHREQPSFSPQIQYPRVWLPNDSDPTPVHYSTGYGGSMNRFHSPEPSSVHQPREISPFSQTMQPLNVTGHARSSHSSHPATHAPGMNGLPFPLSVAAPPPNVSCPAPIPYPFSSASHNPPMNGLPVHPISHLQDSNWSPPSVSRHASHPVSSSPSPPFMPRLADDHYPSAASTPEKPERYLFFPALISSDQPSGCIWDEEESFTFYTAWSLQCSEGHFFTARFLQTLLLRLAFGFAVEKPSSQQGTLHGLECTLWKNGVRWLDLAGIETLVEMVEDSRGIVMVMRGKRGSEMKCIRLRSQVIRKIIESKEQFCHNVKTEESLIDPSQIGRRGYPVITCTLDKLTRYDVLLIARAIASNQEYVYCRQGKKLEAINELLYFEAYTRLGEQLLSDLYEDDTHKSDSAKEDILYRFSQCNEDRVHQIQMVLKITNSYYSPSLSPCSSVNDLPKGGGGYRQCFPIESSPCMAVVNRWWQQDDQTLGDFGRALDDYSIFSSRNILELYRYPFTISMSL